MSLETSLRDLKKRNKAAYAFNLQNLYQLEAAKSTANRMEVPVIMQFSERYLRFLHQKYSIEFILKTYRSEFTFFHLDHCNDLDFIKFCVDAGFDSVMYDGSASPLNINIRNSREIRQYASDMNCLVEGELGKISGVEDGFGDAGSSYAEVEEIKRYIDETGVDLLALGIGNAHGYYESLEGIRLDILREARAQLGDSQLFVLHGGTGLPAQTIEEAIECGVVKINLSTDIKKKTIDLMRAFSDKDNLYNEIAFHQSMTEGLSRLFETYLAKHTV